jgi:hypothetical protein
VRIMIASLTRHKISDEDGSAASLQGKVTSYPES